MNYEQFYFWLKGYIDGTDCDSCPLNRMMIEDKMKQIDEQNKRPTLATTTPWVSQGIMQLTNSR